MDVSERQFRKSNPRDRANIFSILTFSYLSGLWRKAYRHNLHYENLYEVLNQCRSEKCGNKLEKRWKIEYAKKKPSVFRAIIKCWGWKCLIIGIVHFLWNTIVSIVKPYVLSNMVGYFALGQTHTTKNQAYIYACSMLLIHISDILYNSNYDIYIKGLGIEMKTSFSSLLYRKAIRLSPTALTDVYLGNIVSLITRDVHCFVFVIGMVNDTCTAITQIAVVCYLLYEKVGVIAFVGIGIVMSAVPLQIYLGTWITRMRLQIGFRTDKRLQITQEILSTIRIIKMYVWESFFIKNVLRARRKEVLRIIISASLKKLLLFVGITFSSAGRYMLIMACIWKGVSADVSVIFYVLAAFVNLRHWLAIVVPYGMGTVSEFVSAYKRITQALLAEELECQYTDEQPTEKAYLELQNVTVHIKENTVLENISFNLQPGLSIITGAVGCGKSSIFKTILKEYPITNGSVVTMGRISYASQDPWLFPSTIKQNILFGEPYNEHRYQEVLRVCALSYDFSLLDDGDETVLIDRGLNFSKGQQARINLARAVYRESEIYLLDDCLTALDGTVQNYIFKECIKRFLRNKICLLVTQTPNQIEEADNVILLDKGRIKNRDKPNKRTVKEVENLSVRDKNFRNVIKEKEKDANEETKLLEPGDRKGAKIYAEEEKQGSVDFKVYKTCLIYGGGVIMVLAILLFRGLTSFSMNFTEKLLSSWVDKKQVVLSIQKLQSISNSSLDELDEAITNENTVFQHYTVFLIVSNFLEIFTTYLLMEFCRRLSTNLHKAMFQNILNGVMSFFDHHLIGNILNRCSQDMFNIDESLSYALDECIRSIFSVAGIVILLTIVNKQFVLIALLTFCLLMVIRTVYIPAGRALKRLEASTRSPMIGHLNSTLEGLTTIRASKVQNILIKEYDRHQDMFTSAHYMLHCSNRGFGFFVDITCSFFVGFVLVKFLFFDTGATAGDVGLSLTQVSSLTMGITWAIRQWSDLESNMTSLERILEYTDIKTEKKTGAVIPDWPNLGSIIYKNVYLNYNNNKNNVLKNLNFEIKPKQKIGIVGRTGAGKSSIVSSIFRLYDTQGEILIDGVSTKTLALDFLRKNIAVIPQDPVSFSGSIRTNLDPLNEFADDKIWECLDKVGLKKLFFDLDQNVNNSNFSSGQKQLMCLSRAILRKNKIVIMDEASANMDTKTDAELQKIVRENFSGCTILTIAHRLYTVLECDKIMVLDNGEIKEFDSPKILMENTNGLFYKMVKQIE